MSKRVFVIVLDSFGIGAASDAADFGDAGANTLAGVANTGVLSIPNLTALGLGSVDGVSSIEKVDAPLATFARLKERSMGKDTTTGHWEMAGIISDAPMPTFPEGFPRELMDAFDALGDITKSPSREPGNPATWLLFQDAMLGLLDMEIERDDLDDYFANIKKIIKILL